MSAFLIGREPLSLATLRKIARTQPSIALDLTCLSGLQAGADAIEAIVRAGKREAAGLLPSG